MGLGFTAGSAQTTDHLAMMDYLAKRVIVAAFDSRDELFTLVRAEPHLVEARTGLGETPLHYLAVENQLRAVALLVEAGASVNTVSAIGGTPLSEAASLGYVEMVDLLLSRGAALRLAQQHEPTLHEAVRWANPQIVKLLLAAGAPIDEQNELNETALHLAAESDDCLAVLTVLVEAGASLGMRAAFDETALDVALREGCNACAVALAAAGAPRCRTSVV